MDYRRHCCGRRRLSVLQPFGIGRDQPHGPRPEARLRTRQSSPAGPSEAQKQAKADFDTFLGGLGSLWGAAVATHTDIKAQLPRPLPPPNAYAAPSIPVLPPLSPRTDWQAVTFLGLPNSRVFAAWDVYDNYAEEFEAGSTILIISPSENAELKAAGYTGTVFYAPGKNQRMCRFYTSVELGPYLKTL